MKNSFQSLILALQFLTRIPIPVQVPFEVRTVSRSTVFYPLAGLIIGFILYAVSFYLPVGAGLVNGAVLLLLWTLLTGGLHLDGLMDTADGLASRRSREQMLAVMKDSRTGAFGVLAAILILLLKWTALTDLLEQMKQGRLSHSILLFILLLIPAVSRWWMSAAIVSFPYIGGPKGLGQYFQKTKYRHLIASSLFVLAVLIWGSASYRIWAIAGIQLLCGAGFILYLIKKLGGLTGDTYGALNEWVETAGLIAAVYLQSFAGS